MKLSSPPFAVAVLCFFCSSLFSQALSAEDFSSIDSDLQQLETLMNDTLSNTAEQERLLNDLKKNLAESGTLIESYESIITEREQLLRDLQTRLAEMSETYRKQSALSAKYARSSKFWRTFTLIAVPAAAVISGAVGAALARR